MDLIMAKTIVGVAESIAIAIACWKMKSGLPLLGLFFVSVMF